MKYSLEISTLTKKNGIQAYKINNFKYNLTFLTSNFLNFDRS